MNTKTRGLGQRQMCGSATGPIEQPLGALAALLLLAGKMHRMCPLRRRALPAHPLTVHSDQFNSRF